MSNNKEFLEQVHEPRVLSRYKHSGFYSSALFQFLLLGRSRRALELLQMTGELKTQQQLKKRFSKFLSSFKYDESLLCKGSHTVWICWWQGIENAPLLIQRCYRSVIKNLIGWDVVLISKDNFHQYVDLPENIITRLNEGLITPSQVSDFFRLELLIRYGGLWLDASVYCTGNNIPKSILESNLFVFQAQKPNSNGKAIVMSKWCIYAKANNKILMATRELLYHIWNNNHYTHNDRLLNHIFSVVYDFYGEESNGIPAFCNTVPHILSSHLFDAYDELYWGDLKKLTCFHKLDYKQDSAKSRIEGSYYDFILNN